METEGEPRVEQLRLLLDVGKSIVSHRNLREMIGVISGYLRQVIHCDEVWMLVAEPGSEQMRVFGLDMIYKEGSIASEGQLVSVEGMAPPRIMKTLETLIVNPSMLKNSPSPLAKSLIASGVQSGCIAPLVSQGRALGTITMSSWRENAFTPEDAELFTHVAGQLAAAVENALAFQEIEKLKNKLAEEKLYLEEEIQTTWNSEQIHPARITAEAPARFARARIRAFGQRAHPARRRAPGRRDQQRFGGDGRRQTIPR